MRCFLKAQEQGLSSGSEGIWQGFLGRGGVTPEPHYRGATSLNMEKWGIAASKKAESQTKVTSRMGWLGM